MHWNNVSDFSSEFNKLFKVKKWNCLNSDKKMLCINFNWNIFNVPKFNIPNSADVQNSVVRSRDPRKCNRSKMLERSQARRAGVTPNSATHQKVWPKGGLLHTRVWVNGSTCFCTVSQTRERLHACLCFKPVHQTQAPPWVTLCGGSQKSV